MFFSANYLTIHFPSGLHCSPFSFKQSIWPCCCMCMFCINPSYFLIVIVVWRIYLCGRCCCVADVGFTYMFLYIVWCGKTPTELIRIGVNVHGVSGPWVGSRRPLATNRQPPQLKLGLVENGHRCGVVDVFVCASPFVTLFLFLLYLLLCRRCCYEADVAV